MKDKRVLIISSEVVPYLPQTEQAINSFQIPKAINEHGGQTRIFMPRYGLINERRHQLHEVIRLSGMNLVINEMDMPLIIKVASIPKERMQVYFIDNDEYFKRRGILHDNEGDCYNDNDERMIFFTKGVVETVKKFLDIHLLKSTVLSVKIENKKLRYEISPQICKTLINSRISKIIRRGKYLIFLLNNKFAILCHLGMTGCFRILPVNMVLV